jgi:hypothetical protein
MSMAMHGDCKARIMRGPSAGRAAEAGREDLRTVPHVEN